MRPHHTTIKHLTTFAIDTNFSLKVILAYISSAITITWFLLNTSLKCKMHDCLRTSNITVHLLYRYLKVGIACYEKEYLKQCFISQKYVYCPN